MKISAVVTASVGFGRSARLSALFALSALLACEKRSSPTQPPSSLSIATVTFSPPIGRIEVGDTIGLTAVALNSSGGEVPGATYTWSSSDQLTFRLTAEGVGTALALGAAELTVTASSTETSVPVSAKARISVSTAAVAVLRIVGGDGQSGLPGGVLAAPLVVQALTKRGSPAPSAIIRWSSSSNDSIRADSSLAEMSGQGRARIVLGSNVGLRAIRASVGNASTAFSARAVNPVTSVVSVFVEQPVGQLSSSGAQFRAGTSVTNPTSDSTGSVVLGGVLPQLVSVENSSGPIALAIAVPPTDVPIRMSSRSTVEALVFLSPGLSTTNPDEATSILAAIRSSPAFIVAVQAVEAQHRAMPAAALDLTDVSLINALQRVLLSLVQPDISNSMTRATSASVTGYGALSGSTHSLNALTASAASQTLFQLLSHDESNPSASTLADVKVEVLNDEVFRGRNSTRARITNIGLGTDYFIGGSRWLVAVLEYWDPTTSTWVVDESQSGTPAAPNRLLIGENTTAVFNISSARVARISAYGPNKSFVTAGDPHAAYVIWPWIGTLFVRAVVPVVSDIVGLPLDADNDAARTFFGFYVQELSKEFGTDLVGDPANGVALLSGRATELGGTLIKAAVTVIAKNPTVILAWINASLVGQATEARLEQVTALAGRIAWIATLAKVVYHLANTSYVLTAGIPVVNTSLICVTCGIPSGVAAVSGRVTCANHIVPNSDVYVGEQHAVSDVTGKYAIAGVSTGDQAVRLFAPRGWSCSWPASLSVRVVAGQSLIQDISVDTLPTLSAQSPQPLIGALGLTSVTFVGAGFAQGDQLLLRSGSRTLAFPSTSVQIISRNSLVVQAAVGASAAAWSAQVINLNGALSEALAFQVVAPTQLPFALPTIANVTPPSYAATGVQLLTINGTGFQNGATLIFDPPTGSNLTRTSTFVNSGQLTYSFNPAGDVGTWTVTVRNPDNQEVTQSFAVAAPATAAPTISNVTPSTYAATGVQLLTINGANFQSGAVLIFDPPTGSNLTRTPTFVNSGQLTYSFNPAGDVGTWTVTVRNPDGREATMAFVVR